MGSKTWGGGVVIDSTWLQEVNDHVFKAKSFDSAFAVNVLDPVYGATGNGTTDDTSAFQAALNTGRPVYIPKPAVEYKVSALTINTVGQKVFGDGSLSKIHCSSTTQHLFTVNAADVVLQDLKLIGSATTATTPVFAVFTNTATPAKNLKLIRVTASGPNSTTGFTNAFKFDDGCDNSLVFDCYVERLVGSLNGYGYGVLVGNCTNVKTLASTFIGGSLGGRHAVYYSGGANKGKVHGNYISNFQWDGIAQFSQAGQPACADNIISENSIISCVSGGNNTSGGISVAGHASRTQILNNTIVSSGAHGIAIYGEGFADLNDTLLDGNIIINSSLIGIDILSGVGGVIRGGMIKDSSQLTLGTYANVRFITGVTGGSATTTGWLVDSINVPTSAQARSGVQINATLPVPTNIKFSNCTIGLGTVASYEFLGNTFPIDGRIQFSTAHNPANTLPGASEPAQTFTVTGAAVGDNVSVWHSSDQSGMQWFGRVSAVNTVQVWWFNGSAGAIDPANGTLFIDVWKR